MTPKNKNQRRIIEIDDSVKPIGKRIKNWVYEKFFKAPAVRNKSGKITCLKCNHKWISQTKLAWHDEIAESKCPNCKREIFVKSTEKRTLDDASFFSYITTHKEYQIKRVFVVYVYYKTNKEPKYSIQEGYRIYINKDGVKEVVGLLRSGGFYSWNGTFQGSWELRNPKSIENKYSDNTTIYPKWNLQDYVIKAGVSPYDVAESKFDFVTLASTSLMLPQLETIQKIGNESLYNFCFREPETIKKFWPTLRICFRNKYKINSAATYFDMVKAISFFKKDLRNSHYVCPPNFMLAHNYWTDKEYKVKRKKDIERARIAARLAIERGILDKAEYEKKLKKDKLKYDRRMLIYSQLQFVFGKLVIKPLMTLKEVEEAGEAMHHCIFKTSSYWTNKNNLLFGSYYNGVLVETTQYDLSNKQVLHSYGLLNKHSKHHDKIVKIIETGKLKITQSVLEYQRSKKSKELKVA